MRGLAKRRVFLHSLGCAKNLVDAEIMLGRLASDEWEISSEPGDAQAIVVNTCAFIDPAKAESTQTILEYAGAKRPGQKLIVAGCLAQRYGAELRELIPEIDAVVGTGAFPQIAEIIDEATTGARPLHVEDRDRYIETYGLLPRLVTTQRATAYLKISEGCNHTCAFCIIPTLRGLGKSRTIPSLLEEARALVAGGARELILIAQDSSDYGRDIGLRDGLARLIDALDALEDLRWVRVLYLYPTSLTDGAIAALANSRTALPYVDLPLQHAHPTILKAMRRPPQPERYLDLFARLRAAMPTATIRSTFIVGFPGELDEHFEYLLDFLGKARLDRVGFFEYSHEEGTAAYHLPMQVTSVVKKRRLAQGREVQRSISRSIAAARIGEELDVLVEGRKALPLASPARAALGEAVASRGRSAREAPGVDGLLYLKGAHAAGDFVRARVIGFSDFDRFAIPVAAG